MKRGKLFYLMFFHICCLKELCESSKIQKYNESKEFGKHIFQLHLEDMYIMKKIVRDSWPKRKNFSQEILKFMINDKTQHRGWVTSMEGPHYYTVKSTISSNPEFT